MGDVGDVGGPIGSPTLSNMASMSDTKVSPIASKLVDRAVDRAHCRVTQGKKPSGASGGTPNKRLSGNGSRKNSEVCEDTSKPSSLEKTNTNVGTRKSRGSAGNDDGGGGGPDSKRGSLDTEQKKGGGGDPGPKTPERQSVDEGGVRRETQEFGPLETPRDSAADSSVVYMNPSVDAGRFSKDDEHPAYNQFDPAAQSESISQHTNPISEQPSDSTQVLVPVAPFPTESELRVGPTESFMKRHTIKMESDTGDPGHNLHRNAASSELPTLNPDSIPERLRGEILAGEGTRGAGDTNTGNGFAGFISGWGNIFGQGEGVGETGSTQEVQTLMDEMAGEVARKDIEDVKNFSKLFFLEVYKRVSEIAKKAATAANIGGNSGGASTSPARAAPTGQAQQSSGSPKLPSEVKDHLLRTLSDIKSQLESVRNRLTR